jgi:hypothetical protein
MTASTCRRLAASLFILLLASAPVAAQEAAPPPAPEAQAASASPPPEAAPTPCPQLPATAGVTWQDISGPGFLFCKALRDSDGTQVLGVTFNAKQTFRPDPTLKVGDTKIDGHDISWYRASVAGVADTHVRETLIKLNDDLYAHIWLRADDVTAMNAAMQLAEQLRFGNGPSLGK